MWLSTLNGNFWAVLLQITLLYTLIPLLKGRKIPNRFFGFSISLLVSALSGIFSVAVYPFQWQASVLLGFVSGIARVISVMQLTEGIDTKLDDERHRKR